MADILPEISQIRSAIYGEQVRESIASAFTKLNEEGSGKDWQAEIDKKQAALTGGVDISMGSIYRGTASLDKDSTKIEVSLAGHYYLNAQKDTGQTWIDYKPIYRKVIAVNSQGGSGIARQEYELYPTIDTLVRCYGYVTRPGGLIVPMPGIALDINYMIAMEITENGSKFCVITGSGVSITGGHFVLEYTEGAS